jgi:hypothetical protein
MEIGQVPRIWSGWRNPYGHLIRWQFVAAFTQAADRRFRVATGRGFNL